MYEKNIKILKEKFPEIADKLEKTKININFEKVDNSIKINGKFLFSKYNPEKEADILFDKFFDKNVEKVSNIVGIGNPFLLRKIVSQISDAVIYIISFELFKIMLQFFDYIEIIHKGEIKEFTNDIPDPVFITKFEKEFVQFLPTNKNKIENPKIILVKPIYGGSLPVANYCEMNFQKTNVKLKTINSDKCINTFNFISETLYRKENIAKMRIFLADFISEITLQLIEEFKPEIIFALAQAPLNEKVLKYAKEKGIITAFWFVEDFRLFTYWKYYAPLYDYYFTIQKDEFFNELEKLGVKNYHYLPLACEPTIHKPIKLTAEEKKRYGSTISFVGAGYYNRRQFFKKLLDYDFKIWGSDWENEPILQNIIQENGRRVSTEECVKIFNASLINMNLHSSTFYKGIVPDGDFVNPRTFEIAACNAFQLVDKRKYLPLHFKEGEDIITFSSEEELKQHIRNILKGEERYHTIKNASYNRVLAEHTYFHRLKEIAHVIGFNLQTQKTYLTEKDFYLNNFNNLDEICNYIHQKDKVSDTETIFLLMKALKDTYLK